MCIMIFLNQKKALFFKAKRNIEISKNILESNDHFTFIKDTPGSYISYVAWFHFGERENVPSARPRYCQQLAWHPQLGLGSLLSIIKLIGH